MSQSKHERYGSLPLTSEAVIQIEFMEIETALLNKSRPCLSKAAFEGCHQLHYKLYDAEFDPSGWTV